MTTTVVGSIAFDSVSTPAGRRERMLGGAATHFALAASFFDSVRVIGCVGDDFGSAERAVLSLRGIDTAEIDHIVGGRTFFWEGRYSADLGSRTTVATELGVFEHFDPRPCGITGEDVLFLANIQPRVQLRVLEQAADARFIALDSMNLWIEQARDDLIAAIRQVDCVILSDEEIRQVTGQPTVIGSAEEILELGPGTVIVKHGGYGASFFTEQHVFALPAYPIRQPVDPTGAGDTFAGGVLGFIAAHPRASLSPTLFRSAIVAATALASFNVEGFGTERVAALTYADITERAQELIDMTQLDDVLLPPPVANSA
jgi:sugar/nucleoside kinase (ribokinase family)